MKGNIESVLFIYDKTQIMNIIVECKTSLDKKINDVVIAGGNNNNNNRPPNNNNNVVVLFCFQDDEDYENISEVTGETVCFL